MRSSVVGAQLDGSGRTPVRFRTTIGADAAAAHAAHAVRERVWGPNAPPGLDRASSDDGVDHLVVWQQYDRDPAEPVAACRLLRPARAEDSTPRTWPRMGADFDLFRLRSILDETVEAGRFCVVPDAPVEPIMSVLWHGIAAYLRTAHARFLLGVESIPIGDGGAHAAAFEQFARARHWAPPGRRALPWNACSLLGAPRLEMNALTTTLRSWLRLGAVVCGGPAHDEMLNAAVFLLLLDLADQALRLERHFPPQESDSPPLP